MPLDLRHRLRRSPATVQGTPPDPPLHTPAAEEVVIEARSRGAVDLKELNRNRDLLYFLVRRDVVVRYVQTVLGLGWAVLQPLVQMIVFTIFFGRIAKIDSDGQPYAVFSLAALVPWTYFANSVNLAAGSVVASSSVVSKIYFPRLFIPLAPVIATLVDFVVALVVLGAVMAAYGQVPEPSVILLPLLIVVMVVTALGVGLWLSALASRYRDVRLATPFLVQLLLFLTPVIYSASAVPTPARYFYALNPMVGVIDGFRATLLGTGPFPWKLVGIGAAAAFVLLLTGARYFARAQRTFADLA